MPTSRRLYRPNSYNRLPITAFRPVLDRAMFACFDGQETGTAALAALITDEAIDAAAPTDAFASRASRGQYAVPDENPVKDGLSKRSLEIRAKITPGSEALLGAVVLYLHVEGPRLAMAVEEAPMPGRPTFEATWAYNPDSKFFEPDMHARRTTSSPLESDTAFGATAQLIDRAIGHGVITLDVNLYPGS